jgi:hypothetical protein
MLAQGREKLTPYTCSLIAQLQSCTHTGVTQVRRRSGKSGGGLNNGGLRSFPANRSIIQNFKSHSARLSSKAGCAMQEAEEEEGAPGEQTEVGLTAASTESALHK